MPTVTPELVQLRRPPALEPPYDDELTAVRSIFTTRPRRTAQPLLPHLTPHPQARIAPVKPSPRQAARRTDAIGFGRRSTPRHELPNPRIHVQRLVQGLMEMISGTRPLGQLVPWLHESLYFELAAQYGARGGHTASGHRTGVAPQPRVVSVRVCEPADGVAEAGAVVRERNRYYAVALRLEGLDGRWRCTSFSVV
ncbi:MAG TPA: Rv3235 family protein [Mycobacteriales bacterium]|nr:Rv3235 family protein [Mycobacteriales bacterium]